MGIFFKVLFFSLPCASLCLGDVVQPKTVYFEDDIAPLISELSCNNVKCHGSELGVGGLKFAMFAGDNSADYENLAFGYKGRFVKADSPENTLLIKKLSGQAPHFGGEIKTKNPKEFELFLNWVKDGCKYRKEGAPELLYIHPDTPFILLNIGESKKLKFLGEYSDGSVKDISDSVRIQISDKNLKQIKGSEIKAESFGPVYVNASLNRKFCTTNILIKKSEIKKYPKEEANNKIDFLVSKKLQEANIIPSNLCTDAEFIRRLYLDATGLLPSAKEAEDFIKINNPKKREVLIDKVLSSSGFIDKLTMRISDTLRIKSEFPSNLWPNAAQAYHNYLRDAFDAGMPYNILVQNLLLSSGSNFKNPPSNFYRAVSVKNADNYAEAASLVFMGVRTNCIKCHVHPTEEWTPKDASDLAAFFSQIKFKNSKEWKEEILTLDIDEDFGEPKTEYNYIFKESIATASNKDYRESFANWLLSNSNPYFAKAAMSRLWYWIFGIGLIDPADDIRPNKPSTNPELLKYLEDSFQDSGYNFKTMFKLIFMSKTYQRSYKSNATNADDFYFFSRHIPSRIEAESLNDIISGILGVYQPFKSITPEPYAFWPENYKAIELHDGSVSNPFLTLFGKPGRNSSYLNDRSSLLSMQQILHLSDSANINDKLKNSKWLKDLSASNQAIEDKIKILYLSFLNRFPTAKEISINKAYIESGKPLADVYKDIAWALINSKEFLFKL